MSCRNSSLNLDVPTSNRIPLYSFLNSDWDSDISIAYRTAPAEELRTPSCPSALLFLSLSKVTRDRIRGQATKPQPVTLKIGIVPQQERIEPRIHDTRRHLNAAHNTKTPSNGPIRPAPVPKTDPPTSTPHYLPPNAAPGSKQPHAALRLPPNRDHAILAALAPLRRLRVPQFPAPAT